MERERAGDLTRQRFEALFDAHERAVLAYALRRLARRADADDVVSETFAIAWRRLNEVPPEPLPWLLATARRIVANQNRGERRREALRTIVERERPPGPPEERGLLDALASLREKDRESLLLVAWEGLSYADAARVMDCSVAAFAARHTRARTRLASALEATPPALQSAIRAEELGS
ncbi:MAG: RNA polymerase sigma factor [Thermoleophilia bacterium]